MISPRSRPYRARAVITAVGIPATVAWAVAVARALGRRLRAGGLAAEAGMTTAEYAVGTVAACAFAGLLLKIVTSSGVRDLLQSTIQHAFSLVL